MDYLDLIINFFNVTSSSGLARKYFHKFRDTNEYKGDRIISFIGFLTLLITYIAILFGIIYLTDYFLNK